MRNNKRSPSNADERHWSQEKSEAWVSWPKICHELVGREQITWFHLFSLKFNKIWPKKTKPSCVIPSHQFLQDFQARIPRFRLILHLKSLYVIGAPLTDFWQPSHSLKMKMSRFNDLELLSRDEKILILGFLTENVQRLVSRPKIHLFYYFQFESHKFQRNIDKTEVFLLHFNFFL